MRLLLVPSLRGVDGALRARRGVLRALVELSRGGTNIIEASGFVRWDVLHAMCKCTQHTPSRKARHPSDRGDQDHNHNPCTNHSSVF